MSISQKDMIHSLSNLLSWLEQENNWGTNKGELKFIIGRLGEVYTAIMTNGQMAEQTNQKGYDVVSEDNERISVKTTASLQAGRHFSFNRNTLVVVDRVVLVYVDIDELTVRIIYDEPIEVAEKLMAPSTDQKQSIISMSKVMDNVKRQEKRPVIINSATYKQFQINRFENGKIELLKANVSQTPVKPHLREIAKEIGVDINNSKSNLKNTQVLGWDIIKQLNG
ncbi:DUF6998 domain-containing protein [Enterococcus sp. LJL120]